MTNTAYLNTPRAPKGTSIGGEWQAQGHDDSGVILNPGSDAWTQRLHTLQSAGYVSATPTPTSLPPKSAAGVSAWWDQATVTAEYGHADGDIPQMPDDNTPSHGSGNALSGHRRTHRIAYTGGDLTIRMPSRASVDRFAAQNQHRTFDVPVSVDTPDGHRIQGWVRCTPGSAGEWDCHGLGLDGDSEVHVAEGVAAVLEARHPRTALTTVGDLVARRKLRNEQHGFQAQPMTSSWIDSAGYNDETRTMVMATGGRVYGYKMERARFDRIANSYSPGRAFNALVKNRQRRVEVAQCGQCGRFTSDEVAHTCPATVSQRNSGFRNDLAWARATMIAEAQTQATLAMVHELPTTIPSALVNCEGAPQRVGVAEWMQRAVDAKIATGDQDALTAPGRYGAGVPRGFTAAVASDVEPFADELHTPMAYRDGAVNGDHGGLAFQGLNGHAASRLRELLPGQNLRDRHSDGAPTVGSLLELASRNPGTVEVGGGVLPPSTGDERVDVNRLYLFLDTDDQSVAEWQVVNLGLKAGRRPDGVRRVDVPWRPGQRAWTMWWS